MDISKFHIPTLDSPNWGQWLDCIQSTTRILDIRDVMRGDILTPTLNLNRDLLVKLSPPAGTPMATELAMYTTSKAAWSRKNAQYLGLLHATTSNVIWQKHKSLGTAKEVLDALETEFGAAGGTDLPPIGQHGETSVHWFNRSIATDPAISGQLQPDNVEWPQQTFQRLGNLYGITMG